MAYETCTIGTVLDQVNRQYFLPAIQRSYVWKPEQILALFDSLMKEYPINSFLFWEINDDRRVELDIYKFIENFRQGNTHNELIDTSGRQVSLVLDGQQRLTSLLLGLRGSYTIKAKHARLSNPDAWSRQNLYLDLLKNPEETEDDETEIGVTYGFDFHEYQPRNSSRHHWFRVSDILAFADEARFRQCLEAVQASLARDTPPYERQIVASNLTRLHEVVWKDDAIAFHTEVDQSHDRVLDIFVRANDGGTKLSKSDLLLSLVTATWTGRNAREEIFGFVAHINDGLAARNAIDKDFVLKACLVLLGFDVRYRVDNFTVANLRKIEDNWDSIKSAIERTVRLVNDFGINRENLSSLNALLPIAYYLFQRPGADMMGSTEGERRTAHAIQVWLIQCLLTGTFAGSSDRTIAVARATLRDMPPNETTFPTATLLGALSTRSRSAVLTDRGIDDVLSLRYGEKRLFLALSLLYDRQDWGSTATEIDHIIPQALASRRNLMKMNLPENRIAAIVEAADRLGNLQLLLDRENREKSDLSFETWVQTRDGTFLARHLIPDRSDLWRVAMLPEFVTAREAMIRDRLKRMLAV